MGIRLFGNSFSVHDSSCNDLEWISIIEKNDKNPNPKNYEINHTLSYKEYVIVDITYPDCDNFEGRKIILMDKDVFDNCSQKNVFDPHFCENNDFCPLARFKPTRKGWLMAIKLLKILTE